VKLAETLRALQSEDYEIEATGWTGDEIDGLIEGLGSEILGDNDGPEIVEDDIPEPPIEPITQPGDLWILGEHRLLCGDSTNADDVSRLMNGEKAGLCFTSPPYGQQRDYTAESKAKVADWDGLMRGVFGNLHMADDGQVLVNLGLIHRDHEWVPYWDGWIEWMRSQGWKRFGWYVWDQGSGMPGDWNGRFAPSHEFVFHFNRKSVKPEKTVATKPESQKKALQSIKRIKNGELVSAQRDKDGTVRPITGSCDTLGQSHKIPDSVIRIGRNTINDIARQNHPATFPVGFPSLAIQSWPGLIYEPFCGSGTTLIAAQQLGRKCYGMEISPQYCDVIVKRWEQLTGMVAVRSQSN